LPAKELASLAAEMRMPAIAVTDTNNLFGALEFSAAAAAKGVQPIIGLQIGLRRERATDEGASGRPNASTVQDADPIVVLAQNDVGYRNLLKILAQAYLGDNTAAEPLVGLDELAAHAEGLLCLTGGAAGPLGRLLQDEQRDAAEALVERLVETFPGRLYVELQRHGLESERVTEPGFLDIAEARDLPIVATNEAFFATPDVYEAHDALICIAEGALVSQSERRRLTSDHYLKSAAEMRALFADLPEAIDNTLTVARRCAFMVEGIAPILPPYDCGDGLTEADELRRQAREGLEERLAIHVWTAEMADDAARDAAAKPYRERLDFELGVVEEMGFPGYFLIVADFIQWAKRQGIPVGPGRGSGAGSVVAWALTITDLDPLRWGLLFERFLNPERVSMPDFDIDFCQDRRDEVIRYVQEKYGRDHVAQIITFGKLQARAVLRDVGRVLEMPYGYVDKICKLVPNNPANPVSLSQAIAGEPQLRQMMDEDAVVARQIEISLKLEGLYRHASTHAAGVVIGDRPLEELIPLYRDPRSDMPVTGFNMKFVEAAGLVKFDFLGLKTLTVLSEAEKLVRARGGTIDVNDLPLDDPATFAMIARGATTGVFQLESSGMVSVLKGMRPDTFEDIIAIVALYRPGPMDNIPSYVARKHGQEEPDYLYPTLEPILSETFGIMIYQEQVMQIAQELSGYSLGGADLLRRAMGKKIQAEMDQQRQFFIDGAVARNVPEQKASDIFDQVNKFAGYGFNKSHAAAYALVAYQTAYMKANHPLEFLAASMTLDMHNTDKLNVFRQELDRLGIEVLPPDINRSLVTFSVEGEAIRYALTAVKNVGGGAMASLVEARDADGPFASLGDFTERVDPQQINKRALENLVRAGAFDGLESNRRRLYEGAETVLRHAARANEDRNSNQMGLFGGGGDEAANDIALPDVQDWPGMEKLRHEFDAVGFYLSAHPLDAFARSLERIKVVPSATASMATREGPVKLAGTLIAKKERTSARGNRYAFLQFSDTTGVYEVTAFSEILSGARDFLEVGNSVLIRATAQLEGDTVKFLANGLEPIEQAVAGAAAGLRVVVASEAPLATLQQMLAREGRGKGRVEVVARPDPATEVALELPGTYAISPGLLTEARSLPGVVDVAEI